MLSHSYTKGLTCIKVPSKWPRNQCLNSASAECHLQKVTSVASVPIQVPQFTLGTSLPPSLFPNLIITATRYDRLPLTNLNISEGPVQDLGSLSFAGPNPGSFKDFLMLINTKISPTRIIQLHGPGAAANCHIHVHLEKTNHTGRPSRTAVLPTTTTVFPNIFVYLHLCLYFRTWDGVKVPFSREGNAYMRTASPLSAGLRAMLSLLMLSLLCNGYAPLHWGQSAPEIWPSQFTVFPSTPLLTVCFLCRYDGIILCTLFAIWMSRYI